MVIQDGLLVIADANYQAVCDKYYYGSMRINATTGEIDPSYDGDGYKEDIMGSCIAGYNDVARTVIIEPGTKNIITGGEGVFDNGGYPWETSIVARQSFTDGVFDASFGGGDGVLSIYWGSQNWRMNKFAWQTLPGDSTGRIIRVGWAGGQAYECTPNPRIEECPEACAFVLRVWP